MGKDYKHLNVVHKPSNRIVSIFQFTNDATWVGKERDQLIALPADTPNEIKEIEMSFTTGFKRYEGTSKEQQISPFFKRKSGQPQTLSERKVGGESHTHRLAKDEIYTNLFNGDLKINGKTIKELGATDLGVSQEYHSDTGHNISDVFIPFSEYPNHHPKYGRGICIEVQFSNQNDSKTSERTISRIREGWSVFWIWKKDFNSQGKLLIDNLPVAAREEQLKELREDEFENFLKKTNKIGSVLDEKLINSVNDFKIQTKELKDNLFGVWQNEIREHIILPEQEISNEYGEKIRILDCRLEELDSSIDITDDNLKAVKEIGEEVKKEIKDNLDTFNLEVKRLINERLKESLKKELSLIDFKIIRDEFIKKIEEDNNFINEIGDIFLRLKQNELMKSVKLSFPLHVREFFLQKFENMLKDIYNDKYGDINKKLQEIKTKEDLENPKQRLLIENVDSKFYKSMEEKDGESTQSKIT